MNDITARRDGTASVEEMLAAIREAIHEHAQARDDTSAGAAAGARQVAEAAPSGAGAHAGGVSLAEDKPAAAIVQDEAGVGVHDIPAPVALAGDSASCAEAAGFDAEDDAIEWQAGPVHREAASEGAAMAVAQPALAERAGDDGGARGRGEQVAQPETAGSARVVPLAARQAASRAAVMPDSAPAPFVATSSATSSPPLATAPATMGALALQDAPAAPASRPASVVRLSAPVRGRVQQALSRLQAREQLQEMRATPAGEAALREMVQDMMREMLRPMLEEWARKQLPRLVEEQVRSAVAAELARLSSEGGGW